MQKFMIDDMPTSFSPSCHWVVPRNECPLAALLDDIATRDELMHNCTSPTCPILPFEVNVINNFGDEPDDC